MMDARFIVGVIGNVISAGLYLSPCATIKKIWKAKSVEEFSPVPYVVTVLNCAMWVLYGLPFVHKDNILVLTINSAGFVLELIYVAFFIIYSDWSKRRKIFQYLALESIFFVAVFLITMLSLHGEHNRSPFIGILCVLLNIGMYTSPLTIMFKVIKTKSVEYMPFWLTLFSFGNSGIWLTYALLRFDLFIVIPNGIGLLSGLFQLGLYLTYHKRKPEVQLPVTKPDSGEGKPPKEVQLPVKNDDSQV